MWGGGGGNSLRGGGGVASGRSVLCRTKFAVVRGSIRNPPPVVCRVSTARLPGVYRSSTVRRPTVYRRSAACCPGCRGRWDAARKPMRFIGFCRHCHGAACLAQSHAVALHSTYVSICFDLFRFVVVCCVLSSSGARLHEHPEAQKRQQMSANVSIRRTRWGAGRCVNSPCSRARARSARRTRVLYMFSIQSAARGGAKKIVREWEEQSLRGDLRPRQSSSAIRTDAWAEHGDFASRLRRRLRRLRRVAPRTKRSRRRSTC